MTPDAAQRVDKGYFVEFRSRYALSYGHTYVVFGRTNSAGAMINPEVAGLHPASTSNVPYVLGHFVPVPAGTGWSDGDLEEEYRSASWRVMLSSPFQQPISKPSEHQRRFERMTMTLPSWTRPVRRVADTPERQGTQADTRQTVAGKRHILESQKASRGARSPGKARPSLG